MKTIWSIGLRPPWHFYLLQYVRISVNNPENDRGASAISFTDFVLLAPQTSGNG
jgi:hypothetical protein